MAQPTPVLVPVVFLAPEPAFVPQRWVAKKTERLQRLVRGALFAGRGWRCDLRSSVPVPIVRPVAVVFMIVGWLSATGAQRSGE